MHLIFGQVIQLLRDKSYFCQKAVAAIRTYINLYCSVAIRSANLSLTYHNKLTN